MGLVVAYYVGLYGLLSGLTKSTDHPSTGMGRLPLGKLYHPGQSPYSHQPGRQPTTDPEAGDLRVQK